MQANETTLQETQKKQQLQVQALDAYPFQRQQLPIFLSKSTPVIAPAAQYAYIQDMHSPQEWQEKTFNDVTSNFYPPYEQSAELTSRQSSPCSNTSNIVDQQDQEKNEACQDFNSDPRYFRYIEYSSPLDEEQQEPKESSKVQNKGKKASFSPRFTQEHEIRTGVPGGMVVGSEQDTQEESSDSLYYQNHAVLFQYYQDRQIQIYENANTGSVGFGSHHPSAYLDGLHNVLGNGQIPQQQIVNHKKPSASSEAARKYLCTICNKRFTRPSTLKTHMNSHTGERPFACSGEGCGWRFTVLSNLKRHSRICVHVKATQELVADGLTDAGVKNEDGSISWL